MLQATNQMGAELAAGRQAVHQELALILGSLALCLVLVALLFALVQRRWLVKPLQRLRGAFLQLDETGQAETLPQGRERNELSDIVASYNRLIMRLQQEQQQKEGQLSAVSLSLQGMVHQVEEIHHSTRTTEQAVDEGDLMMNELNQLAGEVHQVAAEIAQHAQHNEHSMSQSEQLVGGMLQATAQTGLAIDESSGAGLRWWPTRCATSPPILSAPLARSPRSWCGSPRREISSALCWRGSPRRQPPSASRQSSCARPPRRCGRWRAAQPS